MGIAAAPLDHSASGADFDLFGVVCGLEFRSEDTSGGTAVDLQRGGISVHLSLDRDHVVFQGERNLVAGGS